MKIFRYLLFLCLLPAADRELAAQNNQQEPQRITAKFCILSGLKMSENGRWFVIRKSYNLNRDTVGIFSSRYPENPVGYRTKVKSILFPGNDYILMQGAQQAELLNLKEQTSIYFNGVKKVQGLKGKKQFIVHYTEEKNNRLELRDIDGEILNALDNVSKYYITGRSHIYAIREKRKNEFEVIFVKDKAKEKVYETSQKVEYLNIDPGEQGIIIYEQPPDSISLNIRYLDLKGDNTCSLGEIMSTTSQRGYSEVIGEGSSYFLRLLGSKEKEKNSLVDIWYGNDNRLEQKFYPLSPEACYLWEPGRRQVQRIGTDLLIKNVNIGNERYFLSFDPCLLQDYTKPTPLKINIYDRQEDRYILMDTTARELYTSPDGQYVLYKKNMIWHVYHIPENIQRPVGDNRLSTPYFATDSKIILFEGEGGLWRYDLAKKELVRWNSFEGYRVTILNGTSRITLQGFEFFEKTIDLKKPLVLRLHDSRENRSAYLLWKNGRHDTIIPPTGKRIQNLVYNDACTHFSYTEEDYNLPPRLICKETGKRKKVLYQSNREDKAILSLRQEIIYYTNSNGIPLKGVLYYPLNYSHLQKYPMVVHIYEKQHQLANRYPYPSYYEGLGFNVRLLIENDYFVYLPDILIQGKEGKGPGADALDCVNSALDALAGNSLIDKHSIGLIGHSFGGYETDFIATRSNRFAAYISGSGKSDLIWGYHTFNYNFKWPDYMRVESGQYRMNVPFPDNKELYFNNNPVYYAEKVNAPVLLWSGLDDQNVTSDHSMAFYNALRRNGKKVVALFYKEEGHDLQKPQAQFDLTSRILDWFNYFLKGRTDIEWVNKSVEKKGAP